MSLLYPSQELINFKDIPRRNPGFSFSNFSHPVFRNSLNIVLDVIIDLYNLQIICEKCILYRKLVVIHKDNL